MPKKINPELRARAVRVVQDHQEDYPSVTAVARAVAKQLGLGRETVRRWVRQADIDAGGRPGLTSVEHAEIKRLKAENRRRREDVEILRSATTFLAGELDSRNR
jgi:transposase